MATGIPIHWRLKSQRLQLRGSACAQCGHKMFPPREVCPQCAAAVKWSIFGDKAGIMVDLRQIANERFEVPVPVGEK